MAKAFRKRRVDGFDLNSIASKELSEQEWVQEAGKGLSFEFLNDPSEDVYTLNDGRKIDVSK